MKKATIDNLNQVDRTATIYTDRSAEHTIMEITISTRAEVGERVRLPQISAERTVIESRMISGLKVVHFTAIDWRTLRGIEKTEEQHLKRARDISEPSGNTNTCLAGSESVARAARSKRASPHVNGRPTASEKR